MDAQCIGSAQSGLLISSFRRIRACGQLGKGASNAYQWRERVALHYKF
jgi:hypothetical protein